MSFGSYCYAYNTNNENVQQNQAVPISNIIAKNMSVDFSNNTITVENSGFYFIFFTVFQQNTSSNSGTQAFSLYSQQTGYMQNTQYFSNIGGDGNYNNIYGNCITYIQGGDAISVIYDVSNTAFLPTNSTLQYNNLAPLGETNLQTVPQGSVSNSINFTITILQIIDLPYIFITNLGTASTYYYGYQNIQSGYSFMFNLLNNLGIPSTLYLSSEQIYGNNQVSNIINSQGDFTVLPINTAASYNIQSLIPNQTSTGTPFFVVYTVMSNNQGVQSGVNVPPRLPAANNNNPQYPYIYAACLVTPNSGGEITYPPQSIYGNGATTSNSDASLNIILGFCIVNIIDTANVGLNNPGASNLGLNTGSITNVDTSYFFNSSAASPLTYLANNISLSMFQIPSGKSCCNAYSNISYGSSTEETALVSGNIYQLLSLAAIENLNFQLLSINTGNGIFIPGIVEYTGPLATFYITFSVTVTGTNLTSGSGMPSIALEYFTSDGTQLIYGDIIPATINTSFIDYTPENNFIICGQAIIELGPFIAPSDGNIGQWNCIGIVLPGQNNVQNQVYLYSESTDRGDVVNVSLTAIQIS
jgi:hypothetical protein